MFPISPAASVPSSSSASSSSSSSSTALSAPGSQPIIHRIAIPFGGAGAQSFSLSDLMSRTAMPITALPSGIASTPMNPAILKAKKDLIQLIEGDLFYFEKDSLINAVLVRADKELAEAVKNKDIADPPSTNIEVGIRLVASSVGGYKCGEKARQEVLDALRANRAVLEGAIGEIDASLSSLKVLKRKYPKSGAIQSRLQVMQNLKTLYSLVNSLTTSGPGLDVLIQAPVECSERMNAVSDKDGRTLLEGIKLRYHSLLRGVNHKIKMPPNVLDPDDLDKYRSHVAGLRKKVEASYQNFLKWEAKKGDHEELERLRTDLATAIAPYIHSAEGYNKALVGVLSVGNSSRGLNESLKLATMHVQCSRMPMTDEDLYEIIEFVDKAQMLGLLHSLPQETLTQLRDDLSQVVKMDSVSLDDALEHEINALNRLAAQLSDKRLLSAAALARKSIQNGVRSFIELTEIKDLILGVSDELIGGAEAAMRQANNNTRELHTQIRQYVMQNKAGIVEPEVEVALESVSDVKSLGVPLIPDEYLDVYGKMHRFLWKQLGERQQAVFDILDGRKNVSAVLNLGSADSLSQASSSQPVLSSSEAVGNTQNAVTDGLIEDAVEAASSMPVVPKPESEECVSTEENEAATADREETELEELLESGMLKRSLEAMSGLEDGQPADASSSAVQVTIREKIEAICKHVKDDLYASRNRKVARVISQLKTHGYDFIRQTGGSHQIWRHPLLSRPIVLAAHPGELVNRNTMKDIEEQLKMLESIKSQPADNKTVSSSSAKGPSGKSKQVNPKSRGRKGPKR